MVGLLDSNVNEVPKLNGFSATANIRIPISPVRKGPYLPIRMSPYLPIWKGPDYMSVLRWVTFCQFGSVLLCQSGRVFNRRTGMVLIPQTRVILDHQVGESLYADPEGS